VTNANANAGLLFPGGIGGFQAPPPFTGGGLQVS